MKLLAWDTSSKAAALVALEWEAPSRKGWSDVRQIAELNLDVTTTQSERLLWGIDQILEAARWKLQEVDVLAVGQGPGSFTGLRIGMTTARTLAHSLKKPLIGISSLAALARPAAIWASQFRKRAVVIACTDACKGELFALWGSARSVMDCSAMGQGDFPGLWKRGVEERVLAPDALMKEIKRKLMEGGPAQKDALWVAVGEGRKRYPEAWKKLPGAREVEVTLPFSDQVQGRYLGQLAWEAFQTGLAREALLVHPRYLRASDAELKLRAGMLPPGPTRGN